VQDLQDNQGLPAPADPSAAAYSPERPLITNKSNKLEWQEGQPHAVCDVICSPTEAGAFMLPLALIVVVY